MTIPADRIPALRRAGIALEVAASALNAIAPRVEAGQSSVHEFERVLDTYEMARAEFRVALENSTIESPAAIERWLAL
jgi:hypothetical protein